MIIETLIVLDNTYEGFFGAPVTGIFMNMEDGSVEQFEDGVNVEPES